MHSILCRSGTARPVRDKAYVKRGKITEDEVDIVLSEKKQLTDGKYQQLVLQGLIQILLEQQALLILLVTLHYL